MLGGNTATGLVAVYPVKEGTQGAMGFRRNDDDRTYTLYLHGVFSDYPQLRPEGVRECKVTKRTDANGKPCLVINLNGGLAKRRGNCDSDSSGSQTKSS